MIVLDTNVVSEPMKSKGDPAVDEGNVISVADGQIAAIAAVHGFSVATRDTAPFVAAGVPVINPWKVSNPSANR